MHDLELWDLLFFACDHFSHILMHTHIHTDIHTRAHKQYGTGWVCLFKHSKSLLISNLSEFCPTSCVSTRVRVYTAGCQCLSQQFVVSHSLMISMLEGMFIYDVKSIMNNYDSLKLQYTNYNKWICLYTCMSFEFLLLCILQILVNKFNSAIQTQKSRLNQLEEDTSTLVDDISSLKVKVECQGH